MNRPMNRPMTTIRKVISSTITKLLGTREQGGQLAALAMAALAIKKLENEVRLSNRSLKAGRYGEAAKRSLNTFRTAGKTAEKIMDDRIPLSSRRKLTEVIAAVRIVSALDISRAYDRLDPRKEGRKWLFRALEIGEVSDGRVKEVAMKILATAEAFYIAGVISYSEGLEKESEKHLWRQIEESEKQIGPFCDEKIRALCKLAIIACVRGDDEEGYRFHSRAYDCACVTRGRPRCSEEAKRASFVKLVPPLVEETKRRIAERMANEKGEVMTQ